MVRCLEIIVRSSLVNQESAVVYVIFSLAMKWHKRGLSAKLFQWNTEIKRSQKQAMLNKACHRLSSNLKLPRLKSTVGLEQRSLCSAVNIH